MEASVVDVPARENKEAVDPPPVAALEQAAELERQDSGISGSPASTPEPETEPDSRADDSGPCDVDGLVQGRKLMS